MEEDIACVATFRTRAEADMARVALEVEEIPSYVSADDAGGFAPYLLTGAGGARLYVRQSDIERAKIVLDP